MHLLHLVFHHVLLHLMVHKVIVELINIIIGVVLMVHKVIVELINIHEHITIIDTVMMVIAHILIHQFHHHHFFEDIIWRTVTVGEPIVIVVVVILTMGVAIHFLKHLMNENNLLLLFLIGRSQESIDELVRRPERGQAEFRSILLAALGHSQFQVDGLSFDVLLTPAAFHGFHADPRLVHLMLALSWVFPGCREST